MEVSNISQNDFESMFGGATAEQEKQQGSGFSSFENDSIFKPQAPVETPDPNVVKTPEEIAAEEAAVLLETEDNKDKNEDSLFSPEENKTSKFDIKSYFDAKIKEGTFLPLEDGKMDTPEDIDALIEANFSHKIEEIQDNVARNWYETKSEAWKYIAANAERFDNPADLIPLLTGVSNIETISSLDPNDESQAETIVRLALSNRNESPDVIEEQITMFKEAKKLESMAGKYQPLLVKEENNRLAEISRQKDATDAANEQMIKAIHQDAVSILETPFLGKHKMTNEEKAGIYDLIAEPTERGGGYKIFTGIDALYETKDFDTLREIALILHNKKAHRHYLGVTIGSENAENVMRKLKTTNTGSTSTEADTPEQPRLQRQSPPKNGSSGFGFFNK